MNEGERITEVVERWRDDLAALGGRDPLLSFRDLKVGTLDLAAAEPESRRALLDGEPVPISKLFPHEPLRSSALRSARAIRDKAQELFEERGIRASLLAVGIATWSNPFVAHRPTAPVLLRTAAVTAQDAAETDFLITVADDPIVNPVLLHALDTQVGLRFNADDLRDHSGQLKYPTVVERLREFAPPHVVDGFSIAHRAVLATFTIEPRLLARDVDDLAAELAQHDVAAALAGDDAARTAVAAPHPPVDPAYLAVDTDDAQHGAIAAAAGGGNVIIDAPPGTGRTQTVAGLIGELIGRGKRVLVISPKRATARDLLDRLRSAGLSDVALDVGGMPTADAVREVIATAGRLAAAPADDATPGPDRAEELRRRLDAYRDALHRVREPWDLSAYDAMVAVATTPQSARSEVRIAPDVLAQLTSMADLRARLREYAELEGLTLTREGSPWWGSDVRTTEAADALATTVVGLRDTYVPQLRDAATRAAVEVGLAAPTSIAECAEVVDLLTSVQKTVSTFGSQLWDEPIDSLAASMGGKAERAEIGNAPGFLARRKLRRRVHELAGESGKQDRDTLRRRLMAARDQLAVWKKRCRDGRSPRTGEHLPKAIDAMTAVRRRLTALTEANPRTEGIAELPFAEAAKRLNALATDDGHLRALPRLTTLETELRAAGLDPLLEELRRRGSRPARAEETLTYVQFASLLEHWRTVDDALAGVDIHEHRRLVEEFRTAGDSEVRASAARVLRAHAEHFADVCDEFEGQASVLFGEGAREIPRTLRELVETAPDVALAGVPCWVVPPLAVPGALPPRRLFDVVIIDDAARVPVAEAIPAIARASRVVLIADEELASPPFATAVGPTPDPDEHEGPWAGDPPESVADAMRGILPLHGLLRQYRARDDRLVGFAARTTYPGRMVSVPAAWDSGRVALELVEAPTGGDDDPVDSSSAEVNRVVDLVLEHLRARPHESLGVITLGPRHAERLDAALRRALVRAPDVAGRLRADRAEPFFVKDVDRVAGDVRDAIILSLGYGRSVDGRILYRFGALGRPGGERRLASATTRARERMTVVSTFGADDLSPRRLTSPGSQALRDFLAYVERGGRLPHEATAVGSDGPRPGIDALAEAVATRLRRAGAEVELGYGGREGVPIAVRHPSRRDRFVLAVDTDTPEGPARRSARERERIRPVLLARQGWHVHRTWAQAWAADPDAEAKKLVEAYEQAVAAADAYDWAVAAAEADMDAGSPGDAPAAAGTSGTGDDSPAAPSTDKPSDVDPPSSIDAPSDVDASSKESDGGRDGDREGPDDAEADTEPAEPSREGEPPSLRTGWTVTDYTVRELAGVARWIESDGVVRPDDTVVDLVAAELRLPMDDARTRDVLGHAVRVARAERAPSTV